MPKFQILTLGIPKIETSPPQDLSPLRRRERAILFLLAAQEKPITRDQILDLLWGEGRDLQKARRSLSVSLSRIRQVLPQGALIAEDNSIYLITDKGVFSDYRAFMHAARTYLPQAERIPDNETLPESLLAPLLEAAELYRGKFLQGFTPPHEASEFDNWLIRTTDNLEQTYVGIVRRLAWHFWVKRDLAGALKFARQALNLAPEDTALLLMVMRALHWQGKHAVAHDFLAEMRARHKELLGTDYPETILQACRPYLKPAPYRPYSRTSAQTPFVGYKSELQILQNRLLDGGTWLVTGHPGQGKSRFLEELSARLSGRWRTFAVFCHQGESHLPFAPLLEAFSKQVTPEEWKKVPQEWWSYLMVLFPEIEPLLPPVILPKPSASLQVQFMEAMRQVLLVMAKEYPLLLAIDDIQWADPATLEAIIYWSRREPFTAPPLAAVVMTSRYGELESSTIGSRILPLLHSGKIVQIPLNGLAPEEVRSLAEHVAGRIFAPDEVETLWQISMAGTPLYLLEILRFQLKTGNVNKPVQQWMLPHTLTALLKSRLHGLSERALDVLEHLAVQGSEITHHVLQKAVKQNEESLSRAIDELVKAGWLEVNWENGKAKYALMHHRMGEVIAEQIPPGKRRLINARLARAWEEIAEANARRRAAIIAKFYDNASEPNAAFHWWLEAAHYALSIGVAEQAHQAFQNAERIMRSEDAMFTDKQIWSLYAEWQVLAADTFALDVLRHIVEQLKKLARLRGSTLLEGAAFNAEAVLASRSDNITEEERLSREAVQILQIEPGAELALAEACATLGGALSIQIKVKESLRILQQGLNAIKGKEHEKDATRALGSLHYQLAVSWALAMEPQKALTHANASLDAYRRTHRVFGIAHALAARTLALLRLQRYSEALRDCQNAREQARILKKARLWGFLSAYCAMIQMPLGKLGQVTKVVQEVEAEKAAGKHIPRGAEYMIIGVVGDGFLYLQDWEKAEQFYRQALEIGGDMLAPGDILPRLALAHAFMGKYEQARQEIETVFSIYRRELGKPSTFVKVDKAVIEYLSGNHEEAEQILTPILEHDRPKNFGALALGYLTLSHTLADRGDKASAIRAAQQSFNLAKQSENFWMQLHSLMKLAELHGLSPSQSDHLARLYRQISAFADDEFWGEAVRRFLNNTLATTRLTNLAL